MLVLKRWLVQEEWVLMYDNCSGNDFFICLKMLNLKMLLHICVWKIIYFYGNKICKFDLWFQLFILTMVSGTGIPFLNSASIPFPSAIKNLPFPYIYEFFHYPSYLFPFGKVIVPFPSIFPCLKSPEYFRPSTKV